MRQPKKTKRFGWHEVEKGNFKGALHVATESYRQFVAELFFLHDYLHRRLLPTDPEEIHMRGILVDLQNILEHESEGLIEYFIVHNPNKKNHVFQKKLADGFVTFKAKFEWLKAKGLLSDHDREIMEEIRVLRNAFIHARPTSKRPKYKYFGKALLTRTSVRRLFVDVEIVLKKIRSQSGVTQKWQTVPPGYATELKWSKEAIEIFDGGVKAGST